MIFLTNMQHTCWQYSSNLLCLNWIWLSDLHTVAVFWNIENAITSLCRQRSRDSRMCVSVLKNSYKSVPINLDVNQNLAGHSCINCIWPVWSRWKVLSVDSRSIFLIPSSPLLLSNLDTRLIYSILLVISPLNPRTAKLFQLTFAAKGGCCNPPGFWSNRPHFFVKFFMGIVSGSRNPMVIVRIFYLYHVTLKLEDKFSRYCSWKGELLSLTFTFKITEWLLGIYW